MRYTDEDIIELISNPELYLEREKLNEEAEVNSELKKRVYEYEKTMLVLYNAKNRDFVGNYFKENPISEIDGTKANPFTTLWKNNWGKFALAASLLIALGFGFNKNWWQNKNVDFAQNDGLQSEKADEVPFEMNQEAVLQSFLENKIVLDKIPGKLGDALIALNGGSHSKVLEEIKKLEAISFPERKIANEDGEILFGASDEKEKKSLNANQLNTEEQYRELLLGLSYLKIGDTKNALVKLNLVNTPELREDADWYRVLALYTNKEYDKVRALTLKITQEEKHKYWAEAIVLLDELKK